MPRTRGPRKTYSLPNKDFRLFKISTGAGGGGDMPCPRNAAGERASEAGPGQGPLVGGPRDADGFLKKAFDDALKIVIYEDMSLGEREFAIEFMKNDTPAPPGSPNACMSKYERAIIATYNFITTEDMNGDTHIDELLQRARAKGRPERLPKNPLILPGVEVKKKAEAPQAQSFQGNITIARLAALEGGAVHNANEAGSESESVEVSSLPPSALEPGEVKTFLDRPYRSKIPSKRENITETWPTIKQAIRAAADDVRKQAREYYADYAQMKAANLMLPEAAVRIIETRPNSYTYVDIIIGEATGNEKIYSSDDDTGSVRYNRYRDDLSGVVASLHFHWVNLTPSTTDMDTARKIANELIENARLNGGEEAMERVVYEAWVASYESESLYFKLSD